MTAPSGAAPRLLIIGTSHVEVLHHALAGTGQAELLVPSPGPGTGDVWLAGGFEVEVISTWSAGPLLRKRELRLDRRDWTPAPAVVCVGMAGNLHNLMGLFEGPLPFRLGTETGAVPPLPPAGTTESPARRFVPQDMMAAHFEERLARFDDWSAAIHSHFAGAAYLHLTNPPPARIDHATLSTVFPRGGELERIFGIRAPDTEDGLLPPPLRMALWDLETRHAAARAARLGAAVLPPPGEARDAEGFLERAYWDWDPTHGNLAYGRLMLDRVLAAARGSPA